MVLKVAEVSEGAGGACTNQWGWILMVRVNNTFGIFGHKALRFLPHLFVSRRLRKSLISLAFRCFPHCEIEF
jgi:hypothetical protein